MEGLGHVKEIAFYSKDNGKILKGFEQGSYMLQFTFLKTHFGCHVESRLKRGLGRSREPA